MNDIVVETIDRLINDTVVYRINEPHKKEAIFEPISDDYWKECVRLFLVAAVYYLEENRTSPCYEDMCKLTEMVQHMNANDLNDMFCSDGSNSLAYKYYTSFCEKSGKCVVTAIITANLEIKKIYFDKQRIAEFERVFEI